MYIRGELSMIPEETRAIRKAKERATALTEDRAPPTCVQYPSAKLITETLEAIMRLSDLANNVDERLIHADLIRLEQALREGDVVNALMMCSRIAETVSR